MHRSYLVIFNVAKRRNLGGLIRVADALGAAEILIVGRRRFGAYGHFGTDDGRRRRHFYTLEDAVTDLREREVAIVGVEIDADSEPIESQPFTGHTAFLVGNEGDGLTTEQRSVCDRMVYVRQFGKGASLNVVVAAGIVLHEFAVWAGYEENRREGQKFLPASEGRVES